MNIHLIASGPSYKDFPGKSTKEDQIWVNAPWLMQTWLDFEPDYWFEMHQYGHVLRDSGEWMKRKGQNIIKTKEYFFNLLPNLATPVYMQKQYVGIPASLEYPLKDVVAKFGRIFTSSAAYMLALAALKKPNKIFTWGIHMDSSGEYAFQREAYQYLLFFIPKVCKIPIVVNASDILPSRKKPATVKFLYGYNWKLGHPSSKH